MKGKVVLWRNDGPNADGSFPVKITLTHKKKPKKHTFAKCSEQHWDELNQLPKKSHPDFYDLTADVLRYTDKLNSTKFAKFTDLQQALDYVLKDDFEPVENVRIDFYAYWSRYFEYLMSVDREGTAVAYDYAIDSFKRVWPELYWDEITPKFLDFYKRSKRMEGNIQNSGLKSYLAAFKAIYNRAVTSEGLPDNEPFKGLFKDVKVSKRRMKNVYILKKQFRKLEKAKLTSITQQRAVDFSLLQFYLGGADLVDVCFMRKTQLKNGRYWFERKKRGAESYLFDVKVFEKAEKLIQKHQLPATDDSGWMFAVGKKSHSSYINYRKKHNDALKAAFEILELESLPLGEKFTSKCVRKSFQNVAKFEFVDPDIIRELVGHERGDVDAMHYKDKYPEAVRDAGHWKIINTAKKKKKKK